MPLPLEPSIPGPVSIALSALLLLAWLRLTHLGRLTDGAFVDLENIPPDPDPPAVSVVVPCRNEARDVERAIRSFLAQDLPAVDVVAVDDRSEDDTGAILERLAAMDPRLTVVHVRALPEGWLGKNHACAVGARVARGEWLLFTDGDVVLGKDAVRRALAFARPRGLGHVTAAARFVAPGLLERALVGVFSFFMAATTFRCWELHRRGTSGYAGIGSFNLVRRDLYERAGGHTRIAIEVLDDVKLGLLLRRNGVPQALVNGGALVELRWHDGFRRTVLGLVKNAFAAAEYRVGVAVAGAAWLVLLGAGPLALALFAPSAAARAMGGAALALAALDHGLTTRRTAAGSGAEGLLAPFMVVVLAAALLASLTAATVRRGVVWRGTRYPLGQLRRGCLRVANLPASAAPGWSIVGEVRSLEAPSTQRGSGRRHQGPPLP